MDTVQATARVDRDIYTKAQRTLQREGLDIPTAIRVLLTKTANEEAIPFIFNAPRKAPVDYRELERRFDRIVKARLKDAIPTDLDNPEDVRAMIDAGWEEWHGSP